MTDTLATLLRLRQLAADQARRDLAASLADQQTAEQNQANAVAAFQLQAAAAPKDAAHPLASAYASWLPAGLQAAAAAARAADAASAAVTDCREALAQTRAAERAVVHIQQDRKAAAARKLQAKLDNT
jgi:hypothetical protein